MKLPEDEDQGEALTFFGLLDVLNDFERRLRTLENHGLSTSAKRDE